MEPNRSPVRSILLVSVVTCAVLAAAPALAEDEQAPPVSRPAPAPVTTPVPPPDADDDDSGAAYVLGSRLVSGGYGAPELKISGLAGDGMMLVGAQGGWILGHTLVLGGGGYSTVTDVVSPPSLQSIEGDAKLGLGYGGFRIGAILGARRRVHATFGVLIGGGSATSANRSDTFRRADGFFVIEPDAGAELNLARHIRLGLGGSYRFVGGTEAPGFTARRLSAPAAMLTLRFGEF